MLGSACSKGCYGERFHYRSHLRTLFNLRTLRVQKHCLGKGPFAEVDQNSQKNFTQCKVLRKVPLQNIASGDEEGLSPDRQGNVTLPEGMRQA